MQDVEMKKKILSEIMDLMDEKEGDILKSHPKVMAAKVEIEKPEKKDALDMMKSKMPEENEMSDDSDIESEEDMSPEMIKKMLEMYKDMK